MLSRAARRVAPAATAAALLALLLTSCSGAAPGTAKGGTSQGRQVDHLFRGFLAVGVVVFAVIWSLVLWSVVRYRRRGRPAPDAVPSQTRGNGPLELVLTALPLGIVAVLFAFTVRTQGQVDRLRPNPDVRIVVTAFQWQWRFHYVKEGITVVGAPDRYPEMVLPLRAKVRLRLESADVIHSFFVPGFLFKRDVIPRVDNEIELDTVKRGRFDGLCAEFCGLDHARMGFTVRVVDRSDYRAWVDREQGKVPA